MAGRENARIALVAAVCQQRGGFLGLAAVIPVIGLVVEPELMALQCRLGASYDFAYA